MKGDAEMEIVETIKKCIVITISLLLVACASYPTKVSTPENSNTATHDVTIKQGSANPHTTEIPESPFVGSWKVNQRNIFLVKQWLTINIEEKNNSLSGTIIMPGEFSPSGREETYPIEVATNGNKAKISTSGIFSLSATMTLTGPGQAKINSLVTWGTAIKMINKK